MNGNMSSCKWHNFWMAPWVICWQNVTSYMRNLAIILPSNSKFCVEFQYFNGIDGSFEMLQITEFQIITLSCWYFSYFIMLFYQIINWLIIKISFINQYVTKFSIFPLGRKYFLLSFIPASLFAAFAAMT